MAYAPGRWCVPEHADATSSRASAGASLPLLLICQAWHAPARTPRVLATRKGLKPCKAQASSCRASTTASSSGLCICSTSCAGRDSRPHALASCSPVFPRALMQADSAIGLALKLGVLKQTTPEVCPSAKHLAALFHQASTNCVTHNADAVRV